MGFVAQKRSNWPADAMRALSKFLYLSSDATGHQRQDEILKICFGAALSAVENETQMVFLAREYHLAEKIDLPLLLPFDARTPVEILRVSTEPSIGIWIEDRGNNRWIRSDQNLNTDAEIDVQFGFSNWDDIENDLQMVILRLAAQSYASRWEGGKPSPEIMREIEKYRPVRIGWSG